MVSVPKTVERLSFEKWHILSKIKKREKDSDEICSNVKRLEQREKDIEIFEEIVGADFFGILSKKNATFEAILRDFTVRTTSSLLSDLNTVKISFQLSTTLFLWISGAHSYSIIEQISRQYQLHLKIKKKRRKKNVCQV